MNCIVWMLEMRGVWIQACAASCAGTQDEKGFQNDGVINDLGWGITKVWKRGRWQ